MVSTLKVTKIQIPNSDSDVISLDASSGNITVPKPISFNGTVTGTAMVKLLGDSWSSPVGQYDITSSTLTSTYDNYLVVWRITPSGDNITLYGRFSTDGGSSFISSSSYYAHEFTNTGNSVSLGSNGTTQMVLSYSGNGNSTGEFLTGQFYLRDIHNTLYSTTIFGSLNYYNTSGNHGGGMYSGGQTVANRTDTINGFRFVSSSGNLENGEITVYGLTR